MSREAKIIIFGLVLLISFYFKWCTKNDDNVINASVFNDVEEVEDKNYDDPLDLINEEIPDFKKIELPVKCIDITSKKNGHSPYDSYFGKGKYNYDADNTVTVTTSSNSNIVFLLKDIYTGKTIRNEFIRKGTTFSLTNIPYGTYEFSYFAGKVWDDNIYLKDGEIKGGFSCETSFAKGYKISDRIEFEEGYYGEITLKLYGVTNGNLQTKSINENEFF